MSKAVLISIRPKWCELIASGEKTIEVRKTRPKIETPFKCYIYCTKDSKAQFWIAKTYFYLDDHAHNAFDKCGNGAVIGEFVCDRIYGIVPDENGWGEEYGYSEHDCLSDSEMLEYLGDGSRGGFGWHISDLKIYDTPKKLGEFKRHDPTYDFSIFGEISRTYSINRPPQSWCYVEELTP